MTRFKSLREDRDLLQRDIEKLLGITQRRYSYLEREERQATYKEIEIICNFFKVSADYLLGFTNNKKRNY